MVARNQDAGRGRYGRQWISPEGNIYLSLALHSDKPLKDRAGFSFVAAVAVGEVLDEILGNTARVQYKWPNDVLVNDKKIAGILLESSNKVKSALVVGIGINLSSHPEQTIFPATSLVETLNIPIDNNQVSVYLQLLLKSITKWRDTWQSKGLGPVLEQWLAQAWGRDKRIKADIGGEIYYGIFENMTENGALLLKEEDGGYREVTASEVFFGEEA